MSVIISADVFAEYLHYYVIIIMHIIYTLHCHGHGVLHNDPYKPAGFVSTWKYFISSCCATLIANFGLFNYEIGEYAWVG
jgi:hypothetical protein